MALRYSILQGVRDYSRTRDDWRLLCSDELSVMTWSEALASQPHGVIGFIRETNADVVKQATVPIVCVNSECDLTSVIRVRCDAVATGVMAGEYLLSLGYDHFAYCTHVPTHVYSQLRWEGFRKAIEKNGFKARYINLSVGDPSSQQLNFEEFAAIPRSSAVYCVNDHCARHVLNFCEEQSILVPHELAVLGTDNDALYCEDGDVLLSSIDLDHRVVGYRAAQILDRILSGSPTPTAPVLIPPRALIARKSTEAIVNSRHPVVQKALRAIEEHFSDTDFAAAALAAKCGVSARTLGRMFAAEGLPSPYHVLLEERIRQAKRMLAETQLTAEEIAYRSGFNEYSSFFRVFKRSVGCAPSEYR